MNYDKILTRLLDAKALTAEEAFYLLRLCDKAQEPNLTITDPNPITRPYITYDTTTLTTKEPNPCITCQWNGCSYIGESPCSKCTKPGKPEITTSVTTKIDKSNYSIYSNDLGRNTKINEDARLF